MTPGVVMTRQDGRCPQMHADQHGRLALNGTVVDARRRHTDRFAVHKFPAAVFQARRRFPGMEFVNGQQGPAQGLDHHYL
jgi:hypothetical protein